jgi:2',3'-cyclic-nucleotide 2'-phosphodiesterase (5'-nucleotidase family)
MSVCPLKFALVLAPLLAIVLVTPAAALPPAAAKQQVTFAFTGNGLGEVDPCGCANKPMGGLARRAQTWQDRQRNRYAALLLDTGATLAPGADGLPERPGEGPARAALLMETMGYMGYTALHVAAVDISIGMDRLRKLGKQQRVPLLSTNLLLGGKPAFLPTLVKQAGPLKVGVLGLSPQNPPGAKYLKAAGLTVQDPTTAARKAVADLRGQGCTFVVLLSQLSRAEADKLARQVPGIDLVLGSSAMEMSSDLAELGPTLFADAYQKGRTLNEAVVHVRGKAPRFVAGDRRGGLQKEQKEVTAQVAALQRQLDALRTQPAAKAQAARPALEQQLAAKRAKLQRLTLDLDSAPPLAADANTVSLEVVGLEVGLPDDPEVASLVTAYHKKFPKLDGGE